MNEAKSPAKDDEPVLVAVLTPAEWRIVLAHLTCGRYADVADVMDLLTCQLRPQADASREAALQMAAKAKAGAIVAPAVDAETVDTLRVH